MEQSRELLLGSRTTWYLSLVFGIGCTLIIARTYIHARSALDAAEATIREAQKRTTEIEEGDESEHPAPGAPATAAPASHER